jgi:hypothetical protein
MPTSPVILGLPLLLPLAAGAIDDNGNVVQVLDQVRDFHCDAKKLGTYPADSKPATDYGRRCAAEAVKLCKARSPGRPPRCAGRK